MKKKIILVILTTIILLANFTLVLGTDTRFSGSTPSQTETQYYNTSGNISSVTFVLPQNGYTRTGYKFGKWMYGISPRVVYNQGDTVVFTPGVTSSDTRKVMYATWEKKDSVINSAEVEENGITIKLSIAGRTVNETTPPNPDPTVFEYAEGTIDTGYVIRDKNNGNEFVWVPVIADQKIKLEVSSSTDITSITLKDPYNRAMDLGISGSIGNSYLNKNITPNLNGGYTATVVAGGNTQTLKLPVRSLYAQDAYNDYSIAKGKASSGYVDTVDYWASVNTNGGFYIARYEAGTTITNRTSGYASDTVQTIITANGMPVSKADQKPYGYITQIQAKGLAESMYTGATFTCTLPTGAAWDRTIDWVIETDNGIDLGKATYNSSDWGNYNNVSFEVESTALGATDGKTYAAVSNSTKPASSMLLTTGAAPNRNVSNNIFDLAGNVWEWTTEDFSSYLVNRGGHYSIYGSDTPSSYRGYNSSEYASYNMGFRPAIFLPTVYAEEPAINSVEDTNNGITIKLSIAGRTVNETTPPNPDPTVFEYAEGTIDTGYVIRDKNNGNEFVWVPVKADQKLKLEVSSSADITSLELYDPLGEEISLGTVSGKSYNNANIEPTINGGYKAKVTTASGTESVTLVVRSLYAKDTFATVCMGDEYFLSEEWKTTVKVYYGGTDIDDATLYQRMGVTTDEQFVTTSKERHFVVGTSSDGSTTYADSVNANGGFYIARYEAGATIAKTSGSSSDNVDTIKSTNGVPTSKADQTPYNYITQSQALGLAQSMYTGVSFTCTLPTGAAWDRTLGWLVNTNNKSLSDVATDSSDWGNRSNVSFNITRGKYSTNNGNSYTAVSGSYSKPASSVLLTTGAAPNRNVSNNIFDLAGNVYEWTTEAYGSCLVGRGGSYATSGSLNPSSFRSYGDETYIFGILGFRPALYL